jgi:signal transduction histidine kinase
VRRPRTLTWRVVVILAAAAVVPTVVVGGLAIRRAQDDLEREVVRGNLALVRALGASLDATLQDARRALAVGGATWADGPAPPAPATRLDPARAARLVRRLRREVPIVRSLSLITPDGELVAGDPLPPGVDPGFHTFGGYVGDVVFSRGRPVVPMAVQARSRTGELVGVLVAELDLAFIGEALAGSRLGPGAHLVVVDGAGITVARSDSADVGGDTLRGRDPAVDRALGSTQDGWLSAAGVVAVYRNLSSYQSLRGVRWSILLEQPEADAYALARRTARDTLLAGAIALFLALALGTFLAARLTRPLSRLAERADAIAGGGEAPAPPVRGPGEIGVLGERIEDMARRLAERAELQDALARGDRLATIGTLSASVAHEVNNPLTTVMGYAQLMLEDKPEDHPDRPGLELIAGEAARMKTIVAGLLDYARVERPEDDAGRGPADVAAVMRRVATLMGPQLKRSRVELAVDVPADLAEAACGPHALQQVLVNLIQNAAQAMDDGGTITVAAAPGDDGRLAVTVTDDGPGIAPELRARVFEPFFTTKAPGAGTGLGLAVCRRLAQAWSGTLDVDDGPGGRGATFRIVIPSG